ncbi:MAG: hypothetical protein WC565_05870 [Parcubacteria group bacterium]
MNQESLVRVWLVGMLVAALVMAFMPDIYNTFVEERTEIVGESVSDSHIRDIAAEEAAKIQPGVTREYVDERCGALLEVDRTAMGVFVAINDDYEALRDVVTGQADAIVEICDVTADIADWTVAEVIRVERLANRSHWFLILGSVCGLCSMVVLITVAVRQRGKQRGESSKAR